MANFTSVTINGSESTLSTSSGASIGKGPQRIEPDEGPSRGVRNDMASSQPKNMRATISGNSLRTESVGYQSTESPKNSGLPGSLSTIKNSYGHPVGDLSAIDPKTDSIQVGASRCSIETALQQGLLVRSATGNLVETESLKQINGKYLDQQNLDEGPVEKVDLISSNHRGTLDQFYQRVGVNQTNAFIAQALNAAVTGKAADKLINEFSASIGAKEDSVHAWVTEYANDLMEVGIKQAARIGGIDQDRLAQFVGKLPKDQQARLLTGVHWGDKSAFRYLIQLYRGY